MEISIVNMRGKEFTPPNLVAPSAEDEFFSRHGAGRIIDVVRGLPSRRKQIIALRYFEGFSSEDTAHILGDITAGGVRNSAHRALQRLRVRLDQEGFDVRGRTHSRES